MASFNKLLAREKPEIQIRVKERVELASIKLAIRQLYNVLNASQIKQGKLTEAEPSQTEGYIHGDYDPRLSVLKRRIAALGGELKLDILLPTGEHIVLDL
ncbi:transcriptional regulator [Serratia marcescens]|uniref:transcriptional regulator n=1 Tax=Serratia marcescens TaxID=615 RepID=UPI002776B11B|nr:transcriptional regulator [Serratia marcescens]MDP8771905.1 transcriptional regulator [Serratia marcescens]MDP8802309.1 transcriptional regulator [Serratia marcescens]